MQEGERQSSDLPCLCTIGDAQATPIMTTAPLRFLIVDPLEGVRQFSQRLLAGLGFAPDQVRCAASPSEASQIATNWLPDFVITDAFAQLQPDGLALYGELRARHPECRLGLLGFEISPALEARAKALNAQFVLKKPFSAEQLRATLQASLEWLAKERPELAARMVRDSQGRLDTRAGRRIELPPVPLPAPFKAGELVQLAGQRRKVMALVIRQGEQLLQLEGVPGLVQAGKVTR